MIRLHKCKGCGEPFEAPDAFSNNCMLCESMVEFNRQFKSVEGPKGLREDVRTMAREIFIKAVVTELPKCRAGTEIISLIANASVEAAKEYFKVEDNV